MPQIFDVMANENARYKFNELEFPMDDSSESFENQITPLHPGFTQSFQLIDFGKRPLHVQVLLWSSRRHHETHYSSSASFDHTDLMLWGSRGVFKGDKNYKN